MGVRSIADPVENGPHKSDDARSVGDSWACVGLTGVALHLLLGGVALASSNMSSYFGVSTAALGTGILLNYISTIVSSMLGLILAHIALGAVLGLAAGRVVLLLLPNLRKRRKWLRLSAFASVVLLVHCLFCLDGLGRFPQLYADAFQARGGFLAWVQQWAAFRMPKELARLLLLALALTGLVLQIRALLAARAERTPPRALFALALLGALGIGVHSWIVEPAQRQRSYSWNGAAKASTHDAPRNVSSRRRPNILVLAVDSLRPDRISDGADSKEVAPNLLRLAREGVHFDRAYTVFPRTFPSWVSLLTGRYAHHHGVRHMFPTAEDRASLPPTVTKMLAEQGYHTAVVSDFAGDMFPRAQFGFERVIAPYFHFPSILRQRILESDVSLLPYATNGWGLSLFDELRGLADFANPEALTDQVLRLLSRLPEPWFLVVFYGTPHFPYAAPAPYYKMFTDRAYRGPFRYHKPHELVAPARSTADIKQVRQIFDGTVRAVDDQIGRLLNALDSGHGLDGTVVVATADHGENLYEGVLGMGHGDHLRGEASLRVPLILWGPGWIPASKAVAARVRSIDLAPTLLELAGVADTSGGFDGKSLAEFWRGTDVNRSPSAEREVFVESGIWFMNRGEEFFQSQRIAYPSLTELVRVDTATNHEVVLRDEYAGVVETAKHRALYCDGYKLIYVPTRSGIVYELYDPASDPLNEHNLAAELPAVAERLKSRVLEILADGDAQRIKNGFVVGKRSKRQLEPPSPPEWLSRLEHVLDP